MNADKEGRVADFIAVRNLINWLEIRAKRIAQREELGKHCRQIFEQIRPQLMSTHYNWFIAIDAETGNYLLDEKFDGLMQKVKVHYLSNGKVRLTAFRLNEDGYCGLI